MYVSWGKKREERASETWESKEHDAVFGGITRGYFSSGGIQCTQVNCCLNKCLCRTGLFG